MIREPGANSGLLFFHILARARAIISKCKMPFPGIWPPDAAGGSGGELSAAGRDRGVEYEVAVTHGIVADAFAVVPAITRVHREYGATPERPIAPENLVDLGPARPTATQPQIAPDR